jgi:hypothetical protein
VGHGLAAGAAELLVPDPQGRPEGVAGVGGGRLDEDPLEAGLPEQPGVHDRVQRHPAGQAQVGQAAALPQGPGDVQGGLLQQLLDGEGQVLVVLGDGRLRRPGRPEPLQEPPRQPAALAVVGEPGQVDPEQPVGGPLDQVGQLGHELVAAVGGQPHGLALVGVGLEAQVPGEGGVDLAERVGVADLGQPGQP